MEPHRKNRKNQRTKPPRVPIKTYHWEDLRRDRLRGGYPWTHLYKSQFNEKVDASQFMMMEGMQKSKSSSALRKSSDGVNILEVSSTVDSLSKTSRENLELPSSSYFVITEVPSDSDIPSHDDPRGVMIQEEIEDNHNFESESSDNISQYLDKEEPQISDDAQIPPEISMVVGPSSEQETNKERAKSEEPKKRKLSIDSGYSRKSLSRLAIMKKLRGASEKIKDQVEKIKIPRLSIPDFMKGDESKKKKDPEKKAETKPPKDSVVKPTKDSPSNSVKQEKAVYIHIPLKPPEGESDEFSYLEFEEKREAGPPPSPTPSPQPLLPEVKEPSKSPSNSNRSSKTSKSPSEPMEVKETLIMPPANDDRRLSDSDIVAIEILKSQTIDLHENGLNVQGNGNDIYIVQNSDDPHQDDVIIILPEDEDGDGTAKKDSKPPSRSVSRQGSRRIRSKSAEPERKRKLSLESSYSRVSLSKTGILKRFKDAKDKLLSLSRSGSRKEPKKTKSESDLTKKTKKPEQKKVEGPLIIRIPLKPPPGETDEFSYLEFEDKKPDEPIAEKKIEVTSDEHQSSIESPASVQTNDVQFIFLTPPSDDEILDGRDDIPETPMSDDKPFFVSKVGELKEIAKTAVERVSPETKRKAKNEEKMDVDKPEQPPPGSKTEENETHVEPVEEPQQHIEPEERMVIDEEDGLTLTESAMAKQEQNIKAKEIKEESLKSSLKCDVSPILKKKVSFKKRSKDGSKEVYEEVNPPSDGIKAEAKKVEDVSTDDQKKFRLGEIETTQSMSVDEEKSYLDEPKIIKSTSLEEDYNRWSKISDHEYEPINPPPDNASPSVTTPAPTVQFTDTDRRVEQKLSIIGRLREDRSPSREDEAPKDVPRQELQSEFEERFLRASPKPSGKTIVKTSIMKTTSKVSDKTPSSGTTSKSDGSNKAPEGPGRFRQAFRKQAGKLRNKFQGMKKPHLSLPPRPKFTKPNMQKFKFEKPKFNLPKMPDTTKMTLPSFSLPTRKTKRTLKETRQLSTESNAGDSKKSYFDFSTYPRIFKKKPKDDFGSSKETPEFATVPRTAKKIESIKKTKEVDKWKGRDTIRIPLHPEESLDDGTINDREDSVERRMASHMRYDEDIDIDDAFEKENQEIHSASPFSNDYNSRWKHGSFHPDPNLEFREFNRDREYKVTDLDSPAEDEPRPINESFETNNSKDVHSSESSLGIHRRGVLEEIDSDEFFLRQKGISQDNIEVGAYLSSEIREAFKSPNNALLTLQGEPDDYKLKTSNQSLPEVPAKKKQIKKPKRKKTPHVSHEQISFDQGDEDSEPDHYLGNLPPARPKRRSKRNKKAKDAKENVIPYQETIHVEVEPTSMGILGVAQLDDKDTLHDSYRDFKYEDSEEELDFREDDNRPEAPPRRNKSLRSLNFSEHDSILGEYNVDKEIPAETIDVYKQEHEYIIPTPEPPISKPPRTLSNNSSTRSNDREFITDEEVLPPLRPTRSRSWTQSQGGESLNSADLQPCVEESCVQEMRDYMGYAVIDKNHRKEPPLPPPRTPPKLKKETKFFTTPRPLKDEAPIRPLRNYSTLGPARPPRRKYLANLTDEEKAESVNDITQYIEIEEEHKDKDKDKNLQSGEVVQKMRDRPLPAPPRPPRKSRANASQEELKDLESQILDGIESPDVQETTIEIDHSTMVETPKQPSEGIRIKRELITPTHYTYEEETVTHGSLVIEPLNGAKILPDSQLSKRERTVPVTREYDYDDETSEIPEDFKKLKNPESPTKIQADSKTEVEILRAQKLQVTDLDVDRLSVNELLASRIIVSEIEGGSIQANEITSRSGGSLRIGDIELPPSVVQQLFERLQMVAQEQHQVAGEPPKPDDTPTREESAEPGQKKTPIESDLDEAIIPRHKPCNEELEIAEIQTDSPPEPPIRSDSSIKIKEMHQFKEDTPPAADEVQKTPDESQVAMEEVESQLLAQLRNEEGSDELPQRPPRQADRWRTDESEAALKIEEPDVDEEPPPRPPQPHHVDYIPSQPPASFYDLRAQEYVESLEGDIPMAPRRRRLPKSKARPHSSSDDDNGEGSVPRPTTSSVARRRYRSPEPTIPQLTGQLIQACGSAANSSIKRLIAHITNNVLGNADGKQDLHVMVLLMLILIAGLILLGYGENKTVHHHHWEYFNPPKDL